jgi:hypothetical protein
MRRSLGYTFEQSSRLYIVEERSSEVPAVLIDRLRQHFGWRTHSLRGAGGYGSYPQRGKSSDYQVLNASNFLFRIFCSSVLHERYRHTAS